MGTYWKPLPIEWDLNTCSSWQHHKWAWATISSFCSMSLHRNGIQLAAISTIALHSWAGNTHWLVAELKNCLLQFYFIGCKQSHRMILPRGQKSPLRHSSARHSRTVNRNKQIHNIFKHIILFNLSNGQATQFQKGNFHHVSGSCKIALSYRILLLFALRGLPSGKLT